MCFLVPPDFSSSWTPLLFIDPPLKLPLAPGPIVLACRDRQDIDGSGERDSANAFSCELNVLEV